MYCCPQCDFGYDLSAAESAPRALVEGASELAGLVVAGGADAHRRRRPELWSPLEYACHVRDVLMVQRERVFAARLLDCPAFDPMGRDERVVYDGYAGQRPTDVARQLGDAAELLAAAFGRLDPAAWERSVLYRYPELRRRTLRWVAVHTVHEVRHHLLDVRGQLGAESGAGA